MKPDTATASAAGFDALRNYNSNRTAKLTSAPGNRSQCVTNVSVRLARGSHPAGECAHLLDRNYPPTPVRLIQDSNDLTNFAQKSRVPGLTSSPSGSKSLLLPAR
jgi:hypothetical protein